MSRPGASGTDDDLRARIEAIGERFEKAWQRLVPPPLHEFLGDATGEPRARLLHRLYQTLR